MRSPLPPLAMALALLLVPAAWAPAAPDGGTAAEASDAGPWPTDGGSAGEAQPGDAGPAGMAYQMIMGRVAKVDRSKARLTIEDQGRSVELSYDRDTSVFLERRLGTIRDVVPGAQVRVSADGGGLAYWIEVRTLQGGTTGAAGGGGDAGAAAGTPAPSR